MTGTELLGSRIGRIRIVDFVGKGGMGAVYVGYDETLDRKVALKAIHEGRLSEQARARFRREARVLSQLQHPNICLIHDYIEHEQRDFLVLELIEGKSLTEVIRQGTDASTKARIAEQIAAVLIAAHEKGIIHRDLKPSNVMLTTDGNVKVLDFGLARAEAVAASWAPTLDHDDRGMVGADRHVKALDLGPAGSEGEAPSRAATLDHPDREQREPPSPGSDYAVTKLGTVVGTLTYMSPEQARGEPLTPASDMYSFGLVLQELYTGRLARRADLPPEEQLEEAKRGESVSVAGVPRDLAALIDRLKSPAPGTRPSALDAAEQLRRIREKPRRRLMRLAAAAAFLLMAVFSGVTAFQAHRIAEESEKARRESEASKQVSDFLVGLFEVSDPSEARGNTVTAREILDEGTARIEKELEGQPRIQGRLANVMGKVYQSLGLYEPAQRLLENGLAVRRQALGDEHPDVAQSLIDLAWLENGRGRFDRAEDLARQALAMQRRILGDEDPSVAVSLSVLGGVTLNKRDYVAAEALFREGVALRRRLSLEDEDTADLLNNMAIAVARQERFEEGVSLHREALAIRRETLGPGHPSVAQSLNNLGMLYWMSKDIESAEPLLREALELNRAVYGEDHPTTAGSLHNVGLVLRERGSLEEAESLHRRALEIMQARLGEGSVRTAAYVEALAVTVGRAGRLDEEEALLREALAIELENPTPGKVGLLKAKMLLGDCLSRRGRFTEAEPLLVDAHAGLLEALGDAHDLSRQAREAIVSLYGRWGRPERAAALASTGER